MEYMFIKMEQNIQDIGNKTYRKVMVFFIQVYKYGLIHQNIKDFIKTEKNKAKEFINGVMDQNIKDNGSTINYKDLYNYQGTYTWADKNTYSGNWKNNVM